MRHSASGTAASEVGPARHQQSGTVRLWGMLTLSCLISQTGQAMVTFVGELDTASADQAYEYVRGASRPLPCRPRDSGGLMGADMSESGH